MVGFRITGGKGFHITFENGWTVSVQFGPTSYCEHYGNLEPIGADGREELSSKGSATAETAVWGPGGDTLELPDCSGDKVQAYRTPAQVIELLNWAASQETPNE